jgi:heptosyltransferase-2
MNPTREAHVISFLARIPLRVGYEKKWGFLLNRKIPDKKDLGLKHEVESNLELVGLIGAKTEDKSLRINLSQEKLAEAKKILELGGITGNYIVIHPFASYPPKQWPFDNFIALAREIAEEWEVVIIGGKENISLSDKFQRLNSRKRIANLVGKTDLLQLAGILKGANCLISNDSGPVHLACCVETKCLVLFSNAHPARSPLRWSPWGEGHIVIQKPDINDISISEVLHAFSAMQQNERC